MIQSLDEARAPPIAHAQRVETRRKIGSLILPKTQIAQVRQELHGLVICLRLRGVDQRFSLAPELLLSADELVQVPSACGRLLLLLACLLGSPPLSLLPKSGSRKRLSRRYQRGDGARAGSGL